LTKDPCGILPPKGWFTIHWAHPHEAEAYRRGLQNGARKERKAVLKWVKQNKFSTVGTIVELRSWLLLRDRTR
jgi:hypothetical protein